MCNRNSLISQPCKTYYQQLAPCMDVQNLGLHISRMAWQILKRQASRRRGSRCGKLCGVARTLSVWHKPCCVLTDGHSHRHCLTIRVTSRTSNVHIFCLKVAWTDLVFKVFGSKFASNIQRVKYWYQLLWWVEASRWMFRHWMITFFGVSIESVRAA